MTKTISLKSVSVILQGNEILRDISWEIKPGEQWAVLGPNGSGKSTLVKALWGGVPVNRGGIESLPRDQIGYVAFELHQRLMEQEGLQNELRQYSGTIDDITTTQEIVFSAVENRSHEDYERIMELLKIKHLENRSVTALSTGEMRKVLIARALMKKPQLLILDEPFDGLDVNARVDFKVAIKDIIMNGIQIILISHRQDEIVDQITHVLMLKDGATLVKGNKKNVFESHSEFVAQSFQVDPARYHKKRMLNLTQHGDSDASMLIEMNHVTVKYGKIVALDDVTWTMKDGENWAILGPNGSGKSTLLTLILGDNVQAYANDIRIFGRQKGSGESIWEIKKKLGVVSSELQVHYRKHMTAYDVIASGFYDSIGLYHYPTAEQKKVVEEWIHTLDIPHIADKSFYQLSYGQKRLVLIARAMVKPPVLLILDEPCHGLDLTNRQKVLDIIQKIGETKTNILYVTHHEEETLPCITHVLRLRQGRLDSVEPR